MEKKFVSNIPPSKNQPPAGYKLIHNTEVQAGDLMWTTETKDWEPAEEGEIGSPVSAFHAVARKR